MSHINVLFSESAVSKMTNIIKEEAAKLLKFPKEKNKYVNEEYHNVCSLEILNVSSNGRHSGFIF